MKQIPWKLFEILFQIEIIILLHKYLSKNVHTTPSDLT